jgi:RPA family protein
MVDTESQDSSRRQIAYNVPIADILNNHYQKEEGWLPNYVKIGLLKVSRVNIIGVIVSKNIEDNNSTFILDDGSGRIQLQLFNEIGPAEVGDIVRVIGKPREFGSNRYLVPEIIKRLTDKKWIDVRKLEMTLSIQKSAFEKIDKKEQAENTQSTTPITTDTNPQTTTETITSTNTQPVNAQVNTPTSAQTETIPVANKQAETVVNNSSNTLNTETEDFSTSPNSIILDTIRQLDSGAGVSVDEITVKSKVDGVEPWIRKLLEAGDIFEVKPGRYKVLE